MTGMSLVVGVGNRYRGDDGAGILTVERIREVRRVAEVTDCSDLLGLWENEGDVTVIDAMLTGAEPGSILTFDGLTDVLPARTSPSTHSFGLAESIELARALGKLPARLTIYGIEASSFAHGEALTPKVSAAVEKLAASLAAGDT